jgi:hypothetical protein
VLDEEVEEVEPDVDDSVLKIWWYRLLGLGFLLLHKTIGFGFILFHKTILQDI